MKGETTMRRLIILLSVAVAASVGIAAALAHGGDARPPGIAPAAAQPGDDARRVASALSLTAAETAALAKAQTLGRQAMRCLLAHGASRGSDDGVTDATGAATEACADAINANEAFLDSAEFASVLGAAQPKFEAAARCFSRVSGVARGTIVQPEQLTAELRDRLAVANAQCFRPDGLPR